MKKRNARLIMMTMFLIVISSVSCFAAEKELAVVNAEKFGVLTVIKNGRLDYVSLEDVVGNNKTIGAVSGNTAESNIRKVTRDHDLFKTAKDIGICFGE